MNALQQRSSTILRWVTSLLSVAALLVWARWELAGRTYAVVADPARLAEIKAAMRSVPSALGPWLGSDVPLPAGASEVLHATDVISRRFVRVGSGQEVTFALVHCGDVRDMLGHYPPACYPSQGWRLDPDRREELPLRIGREQVSARVYRFSKPERDGVRSMVSVVGLFLLPAREMTSDVARLRLAARTRSVSAAGVGQLQFVFGGWPDIADVGVLVQEILDSIPAESIEPFLSVTTKPEVPRP